MKTKLAATYIIAALLVPIAGYTADMDTKAKAKIEGVKESVKDVVEDSVITSKIKADYAKDKQVSALKIHVDTDKGVVKLTGNAKSQAEADKAVSIAQSTKGVTSVVNEIKVGAAKEGRKSASSTKEGPKAFVKDSTITSRIKARFAKDKQVSALKIHVDTEKGVVKLTGNAKGQAEADKAVAIAQKTKGVTSVVNEIQIGAAADTKSSMSKDGTKDSSMAAKKETAKEFVEDSVITAKIKGDYAKDKQVSALKISVDTDKGVVKLSGTAKSKEEADKAVALAKSTKGVVSVQNDIQIGASK